MKAGVLLLVLAGCCVFTAGCGWYNAPVEPPIALIFTEVAAPMDYNVNATPVGSKRGEASSSQILGMVATGDASIQTAARNGGITTIHSVDYKYVSYVLGVYSKFTTVVIGE